MRRTPPLDARRCAHGHISLHFDPVCTLCGGRTEATRIRPDAVLELVTVVRVNPSGEPYRLGVAVTRAGRARTICRVEGAVRGLGTDEVVLERRDDMIVARATRRSG
jgi:uncharacterized OB-fold protein